MYISAIAIGIYAYGIFFLGMLGLIYPSFIALYTIIYSSMCVFFFLVIFHIRIKSDLRAALQQMKNKYIFFLLILFSLQAGINFIGALAPDTAFDALWYHLTLPKLYLLSHAVIHVPGGLMIYSDMPKLGELLYTAGLTFFDERFANILQWSAGIYISIALFIFSKKYLSVLYACVAVIIFYSNIVVAWESTTAYIDLIRTVFELFSIMSFVRFYETKKRTWVYISAVYMGFAISSKLLGLGSLGIIACLLWFIERSKTYAYRLYIVGIYACIALLIPLPWFIFSYIHTGNPVFPFFTSLYPTHITIFSAVNPFSFLQLVFGLFTASADPISPIYLILLPLLLWGYTTFPPVVRLLSIYAALALYVWFITPHTGGGRFIIPYLPVFSFLSAYILSAYDNKHRLFVLVLLLAVVTLLYRSAATVKYVPVVFGEQTKAQFLTNNLHFSFGDFYDTDRYFRDHVHSSDNVLLYGFHNLYYVDFPFIDASWVKKGDRFNYIATQSTSLPNRFDSWKLVYKNKTTHVSLFFNNKKMQAY